MLTRMLCIVFSVLFVTALWAKDEPTGSEKGNSLLNKLMEAAGEAVEEQANEKIDELTGTYTGKITSLTLIERRGNAVLFSVQYDGIKRSDGVFVQRETLYGGTVLEGFDEEWVPVVDKQGEMRLAIRFTGSEEVDDDWGIESDTSLEEVVSDQIRLSLIRESHPDRPFGTLIFDLPKIWTASNDLDQPPSKESEEEAITLAEEEGTGKPALAPGRFLAPGAVLKPLTTPHAAPGQSGEIRKPNIPAHPVNANRPEKAQRISPQPLMTISDTVDLFALANTADWENGRHQALTFPGTARDKTGFVLTLDEGRLSTGNKAVKLLQTHPEWKEKGEIVGVYPLMMLQKPIKFKAVVGFLEGADKSDGARFYVLLKVDGRLKRLAVKTIRPNQYEPLEVDLSAYQGKPVQLVLKVASGRSSTQDWAVWVAPRLEVAQ